MPSSDPPLLLSVSIPSPFFVDFGLTIQSLLTTIQLRWRNVALLAQPPPTETKWKNILNNSFAFLYRIPQLLNESPNRHSSSNRLDSGLHGPLCTNNTNALSESASRYVDARSMTRLDVCPAHCLQGEANPSLDLIPRQSLGMA